MEAALPPKMICMFSETSDSHAKLAAGDAAASAFETAPVARGSTPSAEAAAPTSVRVTSETDGSMGSFKDRQLPCSLSFAPVLHPTETEQLFHEVQDSQTTLPVTTEAHGHCRRATPSALQPSSHGRLPAAVHNLRFIKDNTSLHRQRPHRSCTMPDVAAGGAASTGKQPRPPERQRPNNAGDEAHTASACQKTRSPWDVALAARSTASAGHHQHASFEAKCNTRERQPATSPSGAVAASQMTKSVSPAGVVRIGGRNRRKRTKYDLAYKQMEELGRFEEEVKSIDLSKVSGSNFVLKLLSNPQHYSYESWKYGCSWPVGADGRRLLLRKLRGVYWSNPEKWQRILEEHNLYRRDLFTLATVQDLFKVTHLMGAEAWDFLLKCTALTQKCDALSSKDIDLGEDEPLEAPSVLDADRHSSQAVGARACQSDEDQYPNSFLGSALPCPGYSRKRSGCVGGEDKELSKRRRGRPRNASLKAERHSSGLAEAGNIDSAEPGDAASKGEAPSRWMNGTEAFSHVKIESEPLLTAISGGYALGSQACLMEGQSVLNQAAQNLSAQSSCSQGLGSASQRSSAPTSGQDWSDSGGGAFANSLALGVDNRVFGGGKNNGGMLKLAAHYTFMAQFMQCCMLVEVQRTLLRLAKEFKPSFPAEREFSQVCPEREVKKVDPTAQACLDSLVQSSNTHLEFVQVIVRQLCLQGDLGDSAASPEKQHSPSKEDDEFLSFMRQLRLLCQKSISSLTASGSHYPASSNDDGSPHLRMLLWRDQQSSNQASEGEPEECLFRGVSKGYPEHSSTPEREGEAKHCVYPPSEVRAEQCLSVASEAAHQEQCLSPASEQELDQCLTLAAAPRRLYSEQRGEGEVFEAGNQRNVHVISGAPRMLCHREAPLRRQPDGVTT
ncbi:hypothetical protein Esti_003039 [Eimeria stiedai]